MATVDVPQQYVCPITLDIMVEPVMDREGNSFEKAAIHDWIRQHGTSPITRAPLAARDLAPNRALLDSINDFKAKHANATLALPSVSATPAEAKASSDIADVVVDLPLALQVIHNDQGECLVSVIPPENPGNDSARAAVDVVCVVDVSGSMGSEAEVQNEQGVKERHGLSYLDVVKHAVLTIAAMLGPKDRLAIVVFTDTSMLLLPLTYMTEAGREEAKTQLDGARPLARTNIWDGLVTAMDLLTKEPTGRNASIMLLTDGQPNIVPPRGHLPTLRQYYDRLDRPAAFTVNTFGFGYSLDSGLLAELAEESNGLYVFIPDSGLVGTVFVNTVSNVLATACNALTVDIEAPCAADGLQVTPTKTGGTARMGSLQFGQSRDLYFKVDPTAAKDVFVKLTYNCGGMAHSIVCERPTAVTDSAFIHMHAARVEYCRTLGRLVGGECSEEPVRAWLSQYGNVPTALVQDMAKDMKTEVSMAVKADAFKKWGSHYLPSLMMANKAQQCNNFKDPSVQHYGGKLFKKLQDAGEAAFLKLPPPKPTIVKRSVGGGYGAVSNGCAPAQPVAMTQYYNVSGGCVAPQCPVAMQGGVAKPAVEVRRGDVLQSGAVVRCVVANVVPNGTMDMVTFPSGLVISPYHPMQDATGKWVFPAENPEGKTFSYDGDFVYSFLLEPDCGTSVVVSGVPIVALGHGMQDDVARHDFLGTSAVVDALSKLPGFHTGRVVVQNYTRDATSHKVNGLVGKDC